MAVALDAAATANIDIDTSNHSTTVAGNITVGTGANRALICAISVGQAALVGLTVTWDVGGTAQAMTLIGSTTATNGTNQTYFYGLVAPTSGAKNINFTVTSGNPDFNACLISFTGVNQTGGTTSFPHGNTATGTAATISITGTSATGDYGIACYSNPDQLVSSVNQTQLYIDNNNNGPVASAANYATGASSLTMTCTLAAASVGWAASFVDIAAASTGTTIFIDANVLAERLDVVRLDDIALLEDLASGRRIDENIASERLNTPDRVDLNVASEWLAATRGDYLAPFELLATARIDYLAPFELTGSARRVDILPAMEVLATVRVDFNVATEYTATARGDNNVPFELTGSAQRIDYNVPSEWLAAVRLDDLIAAETTATVRSDRLSPLELTGGNLRQDWLSPFEDGAGTRADFNVASENTATARVDNNVPFEDLSLSLSVQVDWNVPFELLGTPRSDRLVPFELSGAAQRVDELPPFELLATVRRDTLSPTEATATASPLDIVANEWAAAIRSDRLEPSEAVAGARVDVSVPAFWIASLLTDENVPIEWLTTTTPISITYNIPFELTAAPSLISVTYLIPFELQTIAVTPLTSYANVSISYRIGEVTDAYRIADVSLARRIAEVPVMSIPEPIRLPDTMCFSTIDTRGLNLYPSLFPAGDTVNSITGITVTRCDELPMGPGDLAITPSGYPAPWISPNAAGVTAMAINWWQQVGTAAQVLNGAQSFNEVEYLITVSFNTTGGRDLTFTATQLVSGLVG